MNKKSRDLLPMVLIFCLVFIGLQIGVRDYQLLPVTAADTQNDDSEPGCRTYVLSEVASTEMPVPSFVLMAYVSWFFTLMRYLGHSLLVISGKSTITSGDQARIYGLQGRIYLWRVLISAKALEKMGMVMVRVSSWEG